ncbi:MAG: hypothetical protein LUD29_06385 [Clostridia bacterium]|nr:hypothetical protein [Clostridia bacterium]
MTANKTDGLASSVKELADSVGKVASDMEEVEKDAEYVRKNTPNDGKIMGFLREAAPAFVVLTFLVSIISLFV